jgi:hypothetical protein
MTEVLIVFAKEIISPREIGPRDEVIVFTEEIISRGGCLDLCPAMEQKGLCFSRPASPGCSVASISHA